MPEVVFSKCLDGAKTWRGLPALGCMTRAHIEEQAKFRLLDAEWKAAVVKQCGDPETPKPPASHDAGG